MSLVNKKEFFIEQTNFSVINTCNKVLSYQISPFNAELSNVCQYLTQAILLEVATDSKPGLVTRLSNGAHRDMSIFTFMMSSAVLSKAFYELQEIGSTHAEGPADLFSKVRDYGVQAEKELLRVTKGINTQRGILFAGGLVAAAAGYAKNHNLPSEDLVNVIKEMTAGLVARELRNLARPAATYGEKLYAEYGITGIRGEVEQGFPSVINVGLPALEEAFAKGASINDALLHALIALMTVVEDSNVLWRAGWQTALDVKRKAQAILDLGSVFSPEGRELLQETNNDFVQRHISPGGSADLLSITITLYLIKKKEFPCAII